MLLRMMITRFTTGMIFVSLILFLTAGTIYFYNGWMMLELTAMMMTSVGVYFYKRDPAFLERRLKHKEKEKEQKIIVILSTIFYIAGFTIPGLDFRYGWSEVPLWLELSSAAIFVASYYVIFLVFKVNSYAARVVEVEAGQKVIDSGLYAYVRHPMYSATIVMMISLPLLLGSYFALIPNMFIPLIFIFRLLNEEKVLKRDLPGYAEYCGKVRYRLIPYVW